MQSKIRIPIDDHYFEGTLTIPDNNVGGLVIFVHGSGSSGYSPRNKFLLKLLNDTGLATLIIDLLSIKEAEIDNITKEYRFDIELLTKRLLIITDELLQNESTKSLKFGYFGSSTGAAVAIKAAVQRSDKVFTIVARSGRLDLVESNYLKNLTSSILLIVGSLDIPIIETSHKTIKQLNKVSLKKIILIPGATHLFEEPGKMEQIGRIASNWFKEKLTIL